MSMVSRRRRKSGISAWMRWLTALCVGMVLVVPAHAGRITDMAGRDVTVPGTTHKLWSAYPPLTYLIYALDPSLLVGWNFPLGKESSAFIPGQYREMPVVGGWFGQRTPNIETLGMIKPDVALVWDQSLRAIPGMERQLNSLAIPVVAVKLERISDYPETIRFLGNLLNRRERAGELSAAIAGTVAGMKKFAAAIPAKERKTVFYAIGPDGLNNDCNHMPFLKESIELAGARSAHSCERTEQLGSRLNLEQVIGYDPDVIITQDDTFFRTVKSDRRWQSIRAVRENRVYRIPAQPFNWLNYPPSFMRAIGIRWLAGVVYPERVTYDMAQEVDRFFRLFFRIRLARSQIDSLLAVDREKGGRP